MSRHYSAVVPAGKLVWVAGESSSLHYTGAWPSRKEKRLFLEVALLKPMGDQFRCLTKSHNWIPYAAHKLSCYFCLRLSGSFLRDLSPSVRRLQRPLSFLFKINKNKTTTKNIKASLTPRENLKVKPEHSLKAPKNRKANKSHFVLFRLNKS